MTDLQHLRDWCTKANALATLVVDAQAIVAESKMRQALAKKADNERVVERQKAEGLHASKQLALALAMLFDATNTDSVDAATALLLDVRVACQSTYELYEAWRKVVFLTEVLRSLPEAEPTASRRDELEEAEGKAGALRKEYEVALAAAIRLIPEDSELARLVL